jgi:hypothetical protein
MNIIYKQKRLLGEDLGIDGRGIFKWILKKWDEVCGLDRSGLGCVVMKFQFQKILVFEDGVSISEQNLLDWSKINK